MVIGLLAEAGSTYGAIVKPAPDPIVTPVETGYSVYRTNLAYQIGTGAGSGSYYDGTPRVSAPAQVLQAMSNTSADPVSDPYWNGTNGSFQVSGRLYRTRLTKTWKYDSYNQSGYKGSFEAYTKHWQGYDEQLTYSYTPKTIH